jgi:hypothetical protein
VLGVSPSIPAWHFPLVITGSQAQDDTPRHNRIGQPLDNYLTVAWVDRRLQIFEAGAMPAVQGESGREILRYSRIFPLVPKRPVFRRADTIALT